MTAVLMIIHTALKIRANRYSVEARRVMCILDVQMSVPLETRRRDNVRISSQLFGRSIYCRPTDLYRPSNIPINRPTAAYDPAYFEENL